MPPDETKELFVHKLARKALALILLGAIFALAPCLGFYYIRKGLISLICAMQANKITVGIILTVLHSCGIGLFCFFVEERLLTACYAQYEFSQDGVMAKYPGRAQIGIPWDDFQEVCICYADYTSRPDRQLTKVVCLVKKGEKKNIFGRWKVDNFLHCKSVIRLDYSEELYTEIVSLYQRRVIDYCKK